MITLSIIGSGNVAQHLIRAFSNSEVVKLVQVFARKPESVAHLISKDKISNRFDKLTKVDLMIISVSDPAISDVSSRLPFSGQLVAHTSGSRPIGALDGKNRRGVFYPLQTFSKNKMVDFRTVPICLESENDDDYALLKHVAECISNQLYEINSRQRSALHVAAVFVNNFTNHLYQIGNRICAQNNIPFEILKPLIAETAEKVMSLAPHDAQTGPAKRGDTNTIELHLDFLSDSDLQPIYKILTQSIIADGKKL